MERREFLKATCSLCITAGAGLLTGSMLSCSSIPVYRTTVSRDRLVVPVGLLRDTNLLIIRANDLENDVALQRQEDGTYLALLLRCTHADTALTYTGKGYSCSLHGSLFDLHGRVTSGPAPLPLRELKTEVFLEEIVVHVHGNS